MIRTQIPRFRLPESVIDEEVGYILDIGVEFRERQHIDSLKAGAGRKLRRDFRRHRRAARPRSRHSRPQGSGDEHPHRHRLALERVVRPHRQDRQARDRARRRQHRDGLLPLVEAPRRRRRESHRALGLRGNESVAVGKRRRAARRHPDPQLPRAEIVQARERQAHRHDVRESQSEYDAKGRRNLVPTGEPDSISKCDDVLVAIGQENAFPWIERDIGLEFDKWGMPVVDKVTMQSTIPNVFFGGDAAFGPKNIIWAVAHGHDAAISIDKMCNGEDIKERPEPMVNLMSQKMGIHEWSYDNAISHRSALQGAAEGQEDHAERHQGRSRARLRSQARLCRSAALPQLRRADGVHATSCASSATRASTSARWTASRSRRTARRQDLRARLNAPRCNLTQDLYVSRRAQDRPHHGERRRRVPALRAVRRALPDRRVGHAEIPARNDARGPGLPQHRSAKPHEAYNHHRIKRK